jgi:hypothetical protein
VQIEKTEGGIKNGKSRETGNIVYTRHRTETIKTKKHNTENLKDEQHGPIKIPVVNPSAREG